MFCRIPVRVRLEEAVGVPAVGVPATKPIIRRTGAAAAKGPDARATIDVPDILITDNENGGPFREDVIRDLGTVLRNARNSTPIRTADKVVPPAVKTTRSKTRGVQTDP